MDQLPPNHPPSPPIYHNVPLHAVVALGNLDAEAKQAIPVLEAAFSSEEGSLRQSMEETFGPKKGKQAFRKRASLGL
jgi:hypothetical protein